MIVAGARGSPDSFTERSRMRCFVGTALGLKLQRTRELCLNVDLMKTVEVLANRYALNDTERAGVLQHLIVGGDLSGLRAGQRRHALLAGRRGLRPGYRVRSVGGQAH